MRITTMSLGSRMVLVRISFVCLLCEVVGEGLMGFLSVVALEHPVQTLQLNTRLSNKSWVRFFIAKLSFRSADVLC